MTKPHVEAYRALSEGARRAYQAYMRPIRIELIQQHESKAITTEQFVQRYEQASKAISTRARAID